MKKYGKNTESFKTFYIYEVIDVDTGELLNKEARKGYLTIKIEENESYNKEHKQRIVTKRRFVKHNGQTRIEF